jgi:hypothetical protein
VCYDISEVENAVKHVYGESAKFKKEYTGQQDHDDNLNSCRFTTLRAATAQYSITKSYNDTELLDFSWVSKDDRFKKVNEAGMQYAIKRTRAMSQDTPRAPSMHSRNLVQTTQQHAVNAEARVSSSASSCVQRVTEQSQGWSIDL